MKARIKSLFKERFEVEIYSTESPNEEARFAMLLLEKWGPVCCTANGEDSSGRATFRELTPMETVDRAFQIASLTYLKMEAEGMMVKLPDLCEINKEELKNEETYA